MPLPADVLAAKDRMERADAALRADIESDCPIDVSAARRKRLKPAAVTTSRMRFSPDCAPRHSATSCAREQGVHNRVEKE